MASVNERFNNILNNAQVRNNNQVSVNARFNNILQNANNNKSVISNTRKTFNSAKRAIPEYIRQLEEEQRRIQEEQQKQKSQELKATASRINKISKNNDLSYENNKLANSSSKFNNKNKTTLYNAENISKELNLPKNTIQNIINKQKEKEKNDVLEKMSRNLKNSSIGNSYGGKAVAGAIDAFNALGEGDLLNIVENAESGINTGMANIAYYANKLDSKAREKTNNMGLPGKLLYSSGRNLFLSDNDIEKQSNELDEKLSMYKSKENEKVQKNIESTNSKLTKKIAELSPSIGNNLAGAGMSMINPVAGTAYFIGSASGSYYDDAINRGMDEDKALIYGAVMGTMEGLTEKIAVGNATKAGLLFGKGQIKKSLIRNGISIGENFIQESIMEPIQETSAYLIGGKDKADFTNIGNRMLQSGIDGAISSILISGATAGVSSAQRVEQKIVNGQEVSPLELKKCIKDIQDSGKINIEQIIKDEMQYQSDKVKNEWRDYNTGKKADIQTQNILNEAEDIINKNSNKNLQQKAVKNQINNVKQQINPTQEKMSINPTSGQNKTITQNYIESAVRNNIKQTNAVQKLGQLAEKRGINIAFDEEFFKNNTETNAIYKTENRKRSILFNPNVTVTNKTLQQLEIHELVHDMYNGQDFNKIKEMVLNYDKSKAGYEEARKSLEKLYSKVYDKNSENFSDLIDEEAVADIIGNKLGDEQFINKLVSQSETRSFARKIYDWVVEKLNNMTRSFENMNDYFFWKDIENKFSNAFRQKYQENNSETRFSIQNDNNGNKYIKVDTDQDIFDGIEEKDYSKIAKMYMQDYLKGTTTLSNNDTVNVANKGISKYTNPKQNTKYMTEKMQLSTELKNVLEIAEKVDIGAPTKDSSKFPNWEYYKFNFEVSGRRFEGLINIGIDKNGNKHFYEINKIHTTSNSHVSASEFSSTDFINNSIPQSNENSNTITKYSMQESEKNSENNGKWQERLDTVYKNKDKGTKLSDVKLPPSIEQNKKSGIKPSALINSQMTPDTTSKTTDSSVSSTSNNIIAQNTSNMQESVKKTESTDNQKIRKHYQSVMVSENTTPETKKIAKELMGTDTYVPDSNIKQLERADKIIENAMPNKALESLINKVTNGVEAITADDIAVGERLMQYYSKIGDKGRLSEAIQAEAMAGTIAGRAVQALSMTKRLSPAGQALLLERTITRANEDLKNTRGKDAPQFDYTDEMKDRIMNAKDNQEASKIVDEVYKELGQQVDKGFMGKIDAWRYFAMLANPRTHIRNTVGNAGMATAQITKNKVAGAIEGVASIFNPEMKRTHTVVPASMEVRKFAKDDIKNVEDRLGLNDNKYNPQNRLENNMRTFKHDVFEKTLGKAFQLNNKILEAEDGWGLRAGYKRALAEYMTANKLKPDTITDKQLAKARNYAIEEAKRATFHQECQLASLLNQLSKKNKLAKIGLDATLPYKKTPINIAKTAGEYSPLGLTKSMVYDTVQLRKGNITANQYIDNISKGLTGSGIAVVGFALASMGVIKASGGDDEKEEKFDQARGNQTYSIRIGDNTYSLDWLTPTAIPLFVGAECYELMQTSKETSTSSSDGESPYNRALTSAVNIADAMANAMNPMAEMSMLSGLTSALKSYNQGSSQVLTEIGTNSVKSYINQFTPTALKQIAKTLDEYERDTTSTKTGALPRAVDTTKNQFMNSIPGLRKKLPVKTDIWGEEIKQHDNIGVRFLENSVYPWTRKEISTSKVDSALRKLYEETGESSVLPTAISKTFKIDGQNYRYTNEEYNKYKKEYGKTSYKIINELVSTEDYKKLSEEQKQKTIENVYDYAKEANRIDYAKENNIEIEPSNLYNTIETIKKEGGRTSDYFNYYATVSGMTGQQIERRKNIALLNGKYSKESKIAIYENNTGKDDSLYNAVMKNTGIDINEYLKYKTQEFASDKKDDGTVSGKSISGSKKAKVYNYVNNMKINYDQRLLLLSTQYKLTNYERQRVANYVKNLNINKSEKIAIYEKLQGFTIYKDGRITF